MWSKAMPTFSLKSWLKSGILAYLWLKWLSIMNSAFICSPLRMACEVVLQQTHKKLLSSPLLLLGQCSGALGSRAQGSQGGRAQFELCG